MYVAGEGGGKSQPGTLAVLSCAQYDTASGYHPRHGGGARRGRVRSREVRSVQVTPDTPAVIAELWQAPLEAARSVPRSRRKSEVAALEQAFTFVAEDTTGLSPGFDVRDDSGDGVERQDRARSANRSRDFAHLLGESGFISRRRTTSKSWSLKGATRRRAGPAGTFPSRPAGPRSGRRLALARESVCRHAGVRRA